MLKSTPLFLESVILLFESSKRAIIFNVLIGGLLLFYLYYQQHTPTSLLIAWFITLTLITVVRLIFCYYALHDERLKTNQLVLIRIFVLLTAVMGLCWGMAYILFHPYLNAWHEIMLLLIYGGLSAGAMASLSIYLPAFYAFLLPIYLPAMVLNYLHFTMDRTILFTLFIFFLIMLILSARVINRSLNQVFSLSHDKEDLITKLKQQSLTDTLTNLPNRRSFDQNLPVLLAQAKRYHHFLNIVMIDIDNFKTINDHLGHPAGDSFLQDFGYLLRQHFRRLTDNVFRLGGDEFSAAWLTLQSTEALPYCESLQQAFTEFIQTKLKDGSDLEQQVFKDVTLSIGLVSVEPNPSTNLDYILIVADKTLYHAKQQGKNQIQVKSL